MAAGSKIDFNFLEDAPLEEDKFTGGGHKRSAKALVAAIEHFSGKPNNHSIGLKGGWGSGKSTVIEIAKEELVNKCALFTFDLWQNQNLNFRRAFLEALLQWAKEHYTPSPYNSIFPNMKKPSDYKKEFPFYYFERYSPFGKILRYFKLFPYTHTKDYYAYSEQQIKAVETVTETRSEKQYSFFGYVLVLMTFVWAFVLSIRASDINIIKEFINPNIVTCGFYGIPAFVFISFLIQFIYLWCSSKSFRVSLNKTISLTQNKSEKDIVNESIRKSDPTEYAFKKVFYELLELISKQQKRPIVIVFDNIDRLPISQIAEVWREVRAVIAQEPKSAETAFTAIIPYDRNHILKAFRQASEVEIATAEPNHNKENDNSEAEDIAPPKARKDYEQADVLRKTFDVNISVAAPVTSDLRGYFRDCLEDAYLYSLSKGGDAQGKKADTGNTECNSALTEEQYRNIFGIYDTYLSHIRFNPTPRQVKSFINDFSILWSQRSAYEDEVGNKAGASGGEQASDTKLTPESVAIFLIHREELETNPKLLIKPDSEKPEGKFIKPKYEYYSPLKGKQLTKQLSALAYNVKFKLAFQLLLQPEIKAAIAEDAPAKLEALTGYPDFGEQYEAVLEDMMPDIKLGDAKCGNIVSNYLAIRDKDGVANAEHCINGENRKCCDKILLSMLNPDREIAPLSDWHEIPKCVQLAQIMIDNNPRNRISNLMQAMNKTLPSNRGRNTGETYAKIISAFLTEIEQHPRYRAAELIDKNHTPILSGNVDFCVGMAIGLATSDKKSKLNFEDFDNGELGLKEIDIFSGLMALNDNTDLKNISILEKAWSQLTYLMPNICPASSENIELGIIETVIKVINLEEWEKLSSAAAKISCYRNTLITLGRIIANSTTDKELINSLGKLSIEVLFKFPYDSKTSENQALIIWITSFVKNQDAVKRLADISINETLETTLFLLLSRYGADAIYAWLTNYKDSPLPLYKQVLDAIFSSDDMGDKRTFSLEQLNESFTFLQKEFSGHLKDIVARTIFAEKKKLGMFETASLCPELAKYIKENNISQTYS